MFSPLSKHHRFGEQLWFSTDNNKNVTNKQMLKDQTLLEHFIAQPRSAKAFLSKFQYSN